MSLCLWVDVTLLMGLCYSVYGLCHCVDGVMLLCWWVHVTLLMVSVTLFMGLMLPCLCDCFDGVRLLC